MAHLHQKRVLMYQMSSVYQAGWQESRLVNPLGLSNTHGLGPWDNPELLVISGSWNSFASLKD